MSEAAYRLWMHHPKMFTAGMRLGRTVQFGTLPALTTATYPLITEEGYTLGNVITGGIIRLGPTVLGYTGLLAAGIRLGPSVLAHIGRGLGVGTTAYGVGLAGYGLYTLRDDEKWDWGQAHQFAASMAVPSAVGVSARALWVILPVAGAFAYPQFKYYSRAKDDKRTLGEFYDGENILKGAAIGLGLRALWPFVSGKVFRLSFVQAIARNPLYYLGASTGLAYEDFRHRFEVIDINAKGSVRVVDVTPLAQLGPVGFLLGVPLSPGRTVISSAGNFLNLFGHENNWDEQIQSIRAVALGSYLQSINSLESDTLAFILAYIPYSVEQGLDIITGATELYAVSSPLKVWENFKQLWNLSSLLETPAGEESPLARGGEFGIFVAGLITSLWAFKARAQFYRDLFNSPLTRGRRMNDGDWLTTMARPVKVEMRLGTMRIPHTTLTPLWSELSALQKTGYFLAHTAEQAAWFTPLSAAMSVGLRTFNASEDEKIAAMRRTVTGLSYQMHNVASSAYGMVLLFNALSLGYGAITHPRFTKALNISLTKDIGLFDLAVGNYIRGAPVLGRTLHSALLAETGIYLYFKGHNMNTTAGNYIKIAGLALFSAALMSTAYHLRQAKVMAAKDGSWVHSLFGAETKKWTKTWYNTAYGLGGGALGLYIGHKRGELPSIDKGFNIFAYNEEDWGKAVNYLFYAAGGALGGMFLRSTPNLVAWVPRAAGEAGMIWAAKKGIVDPVLEAMAGHLDSATTFNLKELTAFSLTPWEGKRQVIKYVELDKLLDPVKLIEQGVDKSVAEYLEKPGAKLENILSDDALDMLKQNGIEVSKLGLSQKGLLFDIET